MDTDAVAVLVNAASAGSLSAAARRLGITPMIATRRLASLERDLGVRLMHRTTRSVSLTPEGEAFLPYAQSMLESEAAGRADLRPATDGASGLLRVTASAAFGRKIIGPLIPGLLRANPALRIDLHSTDAVVDIVAAGFDLAIRAARLRDNSLIARSLGPTPRVIAASPAYVAEYGLPQTVEELGRHHCLVLSGVTHWPFIIAGRERQVPVRGRFSASTVDGLYEACLAGAGIASFGTWNVRQDIRAGRLIPVELEGAAPGDLSLWAVYPTSRLVLPKLRVFVTAVEAALAAL